SRSIENREFSLKKSSLLPLPEARHTLFIKGEVDGARKRRIQLLQDGLEILNFIGKLIGTAEQNLILLAAEKLNVVGFFHVDGGDLLHEAGALHGAHNLQRRGHGVL